MLKEKDDLICDLAEYYHVLNIDELPVSTLAALSVGLPPYSRSKRKYTGQNIPDNTGLLALILDGINKLVWMQTKDGAKNRNRPESVFEMLAGTVTQSDVQGFSDAAAFEEARKEILRRGGYLID